MISLLAPNFFNIFSMHLNLGAIFSYVNPLKSIFAFKEVLIK